MVLLSGPEGSVVTNGVFRWVPTEAQGPSTNVVRVLIGDGLEAVTNEFHVVVIEKNRPPSLVPVEPRMIPAGELFQIQLSAVDEDWPVQSLTFRLIAGPAGMTLAEEGTLAWTPSLDQAGREHSVTVEIDDTEEMAQETFTLQVAAVEDSPALRISWNGEQLLIRWKASSRPHRLETSMTWPWVWVAEPTIPVQEGDDLVVRLKPDSAGAFYRLTR